MSSSSHRNPLRKRPRRTAEPSVTLPPPAQGQAPRPPVRVRGHRPPPLGRDSTPFESGRSDSPLPRPPKEPGAHRRRARVGKAPALVIRCHQGWNFSWEKQRFGCTKAGAAGGLVAAGAPGRGRATSAVICAGAVWLLQGTSRTTEVGGRVFPDAQRPLANCHIK